MNTFGRLLRVSILGESHGSHVGVVLDGCPAGLPISSDDFAADLERRRGGKPGTTPRREDDVPEFVSGVFRGRTTGSPLCIMFKNGDTRPADYDKMREVPRPGHADFTARAKFGGCNDYRGGGHFSGRLTVGIVAAGVIAKKLLLPTTVSARVLEAGGAADIESAVAAAAAEGDSVGGLIECRAEPAPVGLGEPFFDSLESVLAHALFSIPAVKGVEFGAGFGVARMRGSACHDEYSDAGGQTVTNNAGGMSGGISSGMPIVMRVAVKPTSSIRVARKSVNMNTGESVMLSTEGRHDACIALRAPVIVEAMVAIVLADMALLEGRLPRVLLNGGEGPGREG